MDTKITSGTGWNLEEGKLTVYGQEAMEYDAKTGAPWKSRQKDIREVILEEGVSGIGKDAFRDCRNLQSVSIPESLEEIGDNAFWGCRSLPSIVFPAGLRKIGEHAFLSCKVLKSITFRGSAPEMGMGIFAGVTAEVYAPTRDPSWNAASMRNTVGSITWKRYAPGTAPVPPASEVPVNAPAPSASEVSVDAPAPSASEVPADAPSSSVSEAPVDTPDDDPEPAPPKKKKKKAASGKREKALSPAAEANSQVSRQDQAEIDEIQQFLQQYNVSKNYAARIHKAYGRDSIRLIQENPYRLADDIFGIGFKIADGLAEKLGIEHDRFIRLQSGLQYSLNQLAERNGHCYAQRAQLLSEAQRNLDVDTQMLDGALDQMVADSDIIRDGSALYLPKFYKAEVGCAEKLRRLISTGKSVRIDADTALRNAGHSGVEYVSEQQDAIREAAKSKVLILTGGPGTGKTTTVKGIISAYKTQKCKILLAAPTGRAAKRLSEATDREAKTIHRLLEAVPGEGFRRNEDKPVEGDVLIVDECSMIDIRLMYGLLNALPDTMTLILVGDVDQLPSVGPGNVLKDIIDSCIAPVIRLSHIHRQAQGSQIIMSAQGINQGVEPDMSNPKGTNFFFETQATDADIAETLVQLCVSRLPSFYNVDAFRDIQVLSPMHKGVCGTDNLNHLLQDALNPVARALKVGDTQIRLGDKVMQTKNDYDKDVFNGDIGKVIQVNTNARRLTVDFDGRGVTYDSSDLDELTLAYAITIHKAQGSEYPIVVMPLTMTHWIMLQRNLLYTAVTRAKDVLVMAGDKTAVSRAVRNDKTDARNTKLAERLRG